MKRLTTTIIIVLLIAVFANLSAEIAVKSFRKLESDMTARIDAPKKDQNGDVCAIIKVVTTQTGFVWEPDGLGIVAAVPKVGEYWLYVPYGAKRLTIKHSQLGVLRDYLYNVPIEKATVYELVLTSDRVVTTVVKEQIQTEFVAITSVPTGADVYIDDKATGKQTPFSGQYPMGIHTYRLSMDLYHPNAGQFELKPDAGTYKIAGVLKPAFGQLQLSTLPESGATIKLNGKLITQTTPCTIDKLKTGKHTLTLSKPLYHDLTETIVVNDGETTQAKFSLKPAHGSLSVTSTPETGAAVIIDDESTGKSTPCVIDKITSGLHTISLRQEWYEPVKKQFAVRDGEKSALDVAMNPLFGTINIQSNPTADIFINNEKIASGNFEGRLAEGIYTIEARKDKHTADIQKVKIITGETKTLNLAPLPQKGILEIQTSPMNATIILDGQNKGTTPAFIRNLLVGDYELKLVLDKHNTIIKSVKIKEQDTLRITETLTKANTNIKTYNQYSGDIQIKVEVSGNYVNITSNPTNANLYVNKKYVGKTPFSIMLRNGTHKIWVEKNGKSADETINIYGNANVKELSESRNIPQFYLSTGIVLPMVLKSDGNTSADSGFGYNFRIGYYKTLGVYAKISTNFSFAKGDYTTANLPNTFYINSNSKSSFSRFGAVGGFMLNIKPVVFYAGAGWGYYDHYYKTDLYNYVDDNFVETINLTTVYQSGLETDAGLIFNINRVGFSVGVSSIAFKYMELNVGLGISL